ncbi:imidazole glycerol phosphate synthase subunit HisH [Synechocystis sp. PCC 7339]|uniref:imidazole glycerol phosphate synthase subunit HisH n=1 Tax=unclassified Synechocystis TaxID=2640012 RepID=UPI001BAF4CEC|nr:MULTISPECIES: imidazole glycerol phosphate synthase subunit HisH [unclassified Synechocystis]QUS59775.1 imidazole glycerol phosphate synthase subunit HisH [Synechocystis sp. PCC 7338]UAJ72767.1 imidazole glycerol phosphate synthase subunit HisH [Synechocystis sp. PCC 7339]
MGYIAVVDYDMGNLHSVCKGLEKVGGNPLVTDHAQVIDGATAIVLPGVGSFDPAVQHLRARGLEEVLKKVIAKGTPFLGICLGSQLLFDSSEEGQEKGLGIFPGQVKHFHSEPGLTIPHMGWNGLEFNQPDLCLWQALPPEPQVYFVHSYYMAPLDPQVVAASTTHGSQTIAAAIAKDNVMAVQFHPEKSSNLGLKILANFVQKVL